MKKANKTYIVKNQMQFFFKLAFDKQIDNFIFDEKSKGFKTVLRNCDFIFDRYHLFMGTYTFKQWAKNLGITRYLKKCNYRMEQRLNREKIKYMDSLENKVIKYLIKGRGFFLFRINDIGRSKKFSNLYKTIGYSLHSLDYLFDDNTQK